MYRLRATHAHAHKLHARTRNVLLFENVQNRKCLQSVISKKKLFCILLLKNLHMSEKSSTFA